MQSATTPIAVWSPPAPAPWTSSGRGDGYRLVVNEMMLSDPESEVANGWVAGYLKEEEGGHIRMQQDQHEGEKAGGWT